MPRYFLEVAYKGTRYSGFQIQQNASTIQSEIEKAFAVLHRKPVALTGSSRTDAGVHALQNYFHFDADAVNPQAVYKLNAILPDDIVIKSMHQMQDAAHCRFDAMSREYE
jgi:tRNA pseudouridine38-40 synthase